MNNLVIDNEFRSWIAPLEKAEYNQLEINIIRDGCIEPLSVWNNTILDGHNRYDICTKNNIPYQTVEIKLNTRQDALNWIIDKQTGRRNLAPWQLSLLRGKRYNAVKQDKYSHPKTGNQIDYGSGRTVETISKQFGVSPATIQRDGNFEKAAEEASKELEIPVMQLTKEQIVKAAREIHREKIKERRQDRIESTPVMPDGKYNVIYADPPWKYDYGFDIHGAADRHYAQMTIEELCNLPIKELTEDNAVLFLWVTSPKLYDAEKIIESWGFKYKTSFIWDKVKHVMGHYNSVRHEFLLICTRGSFPKQSETLHDSVITVERTDEHSEKPEYFRTLIEDMYPKSKKIQLFARQAYPGWENWGNEL